MDTKDSVLLKRRTFLKLTGLLGVATIGGTVLPVKTAEAFLFNRKEYKVKEMRLAMGTFVSITAIHHSKDQAQNAMGLAFEEINRLSSILSRFQEGTPVYELNKKGSLKDTPKELKEVLQASTYYYKISNGAFDITVKPLIDLYQERFAQGHEPTEKEISAVLRNIGLSRLRIRNGYLHFTQENMGITLDGIAKGYIVDRASKILRDNGITNHLINAGGDIRTSGKPEHSNRWTIAIQDPKKHNNYPDIIKMKDGAIATSGNYEVFYDREKMFYHIVDTHTGLSPRETVSVSVLAPTVQQADALSTTVFVLGPKDGIRLVNRIPRCECFVIKRNGQKLHSLGWVG